MILLLGCAAFAGNPIRSSSNLGLGGAIGTWSWGVSGRYYINETVSLQTVAGLYDIFGRYRAAGYGGSSIGLALSQDGLWESPMVIYHDPNIELAWDVGAGLDLALGSGWGAVGVHAIGGLELNLRQYPVDVVLEYRPAVLFAEEAAADPLAGALHIRYYAF